MLRTVRNGARRSSAGRAGRDATSVGLAVVAAMEPAVERRENWAIGYASNAGYPLPQWSPPLNGGSTNAIFTALDALWEP